MKGRLGRIDAVSWLDRENMCRLWAQGLAFEVEEELDDDDDVASGLDVVEGCSGMHMVPSRKR